MAARAAAYRMGNDMVANQAEQDINGRFNRYSDSYKHKKKGNTEDEEEEECAPATLPPPQKKRTEAREPAKPGKPSMNVSDLMVASLPPPNVSGDSDAPVEGRGNKVAPDGAEEVPDSVKASMFSGKGGSNRWVLNPRSTVMRKWDLVIAALLFYTATVTPYDVAFLEPDVNVLFFINRLVDLIFFIDLFFQFFISYYDEKANVWVFDLHKIRSHYLKHWFSIDVVSIIPFDAIGLALGSDAVEKYKVLRLVRLLRLAKLLRIMRAGRIFKRLETTFNIDYTNMEIAKFAMFTLLCTHWLACSWRIVATLEDAPYNWLNIAHRDLVNPLEELSTAEVFGTAVFFSLTHLTVGYGDIVPATMVERMFSLLCMLIGSFMFSYIIGSVASIIAARDQKTNRYYQIMKELNTFMLEGKFPEEVRIRLRDYFRELHNSDAIFSYHHLIKMMSPELRGQVARYMDNSWIEGVKILKGLPVQFLIQVALSMEQQTYPPDELIFELNAENDKFYMVKKGVVARGGRIYTSGMCFCEDALLKGARKQNCFARTMAFSVIYHLERDRFKDIVTKFPETERHFRVLALQQNFRSEVWAYANAVRKFYDKPPIKKSTWLLDSNYTTRMNFYFDKLEVAYRHSHMTKSDHRELTKATSMVQRNFREFMKKKRIKSAKVDKDPMVVVKSHLGDIEDMLKTTKKDLSNRMTALVSGVQSGQSQSMTAMTGEVNKMRSQVIGMVMHKARLQEERELQLQDQVAALSAQVAALTAAVARNVGPVKVATHRGGEGGGGGGGAPPMLEDVDEGEGAGAGGGGMLERPQRPPEPSPVRGGGASPMRGRLGGGGDGEGGSAWNEEQTRP